MFTKDLGQAGHGANCQVQRTAQVCSDPQAVGGRTGRSRIYFRTMDMWSSRLVGGVRTASKIDIRLNRSHSNQDRRTCRLPHTLQRFAQRIFYLSQTKSEFCTGFLEALSSKKCNQNVVYRLANGVRGSKLNVSRCQCCQGSFGSLKQHDQYGSARQCGVGDVLVNAGTINLADKRVTFFVGYQNATHCDRRHSQRCIWCSAWRTESNTEESAGLC